VRGLDTGADDYIVKPVSMSELAARVRAVLRRVRPGLAEDVVRHGDRLTRYGLLGKRQKTVFVLIVKVCCYTTSVRTI